MIPIIAECRENATQMLLLRAVFVGFLGRDRYFRLDGKLWRISEQGKVARSDSEFETRKLELRLAMAQMQRMMRSGKKPPCP